MSTLTVAVSDATLKLLQDLAAEQSTTPEAVAATQLEQTDPDAIRLLGWAGAFASDAPDAARRHHEYLGDGLARRKLGQGSGE